ncbi:MAG: hypothetical protein VW600_21760 [Ferrovibrio sp.]
MLTNTLLLYMTQEAIAKARAKLNARRDEVDSTTEPDMPAGQPAWQTARRPMTKLRAPLRH